MLGVDELTQERWRREAQKQSHRDRLQRDLRHDIETNTISVAPDNGDDVSDALAQMGKPLTAQQFIDKLNLIKPDFFYFEISRADPNIYGLYFTDPNGAHKTPQGKRVSHLCGMESGIMPEKSVLHKTRVKKPNPELIGNPNPTREVDWIEVDTFAGETRGWRTVLARLLHARLITESDVSRHFGWTPHRPSEKWYNATQYYPGE